MSSKALGRFLWSGRGYFWSLCTDGTAPGSISLSLRGRDREVPLLWCNNNEAHTEKKKKKKDILLYSSSSKSHKPVGIFLAFGQMHEGFVQRTRTDAKLEAWRRKASLSKPLQYQRDLSELAAICTNLTWCDLHIIILTEMLQTQHVRHGEDLKSPFTVSLEMCLVTKPCTCMSAIWRYSRQRFFFFPYNFSPLQRSGGKIPKNKKRIQRPFVRMNAKIKLLSILFPMQLCILYSDDPVV